MGFFERFRIKRALKKAKQEEIKDIPSKKEILIEQKEFLKESKELKSMVTSKNKEKVYKSR